MSLYVQSTRLPLNVLTRLGLATVVDHPKSDPAFIDVVMNTYDLVKQAGDRQSYLVKKSPWILSSCGLEGGTEWLNHCPKSTLVTFIPVESR